MPAKVLESPNYLGTDTEDIWALEVVVVEELEPVVGGRNFRQRITTHFVFNTAMIKCENGKFIDFSNIFKI